MKTVPILNPELLEILNKFVPIFEMIEFDKVAMETDTSRQDEYCNEEYKNYIMMQGRQHSGFPGAMVGCEISAEKFSCSDHDLWQRIATPAEQIKEELQAWAGTRNNALSAVYPAGGYISWHNNANAPGYNVLFTWSSEGDGQFDYVDPITKEHVVVPDIKGWQCKFGYYGSYDEPNKLMYHAAKTNCLRATIAYMFNPDETGKQMAEMLIEDISES